MPDTTAAVTYSAYLALGEILTAQHPRSDEHDEMLFIVIHQVYELWFKQMIHETAHAQALLEHGTGPQAIHSMRRVRTILKTVVGQLDVLETLTPVQYAGFRDRLESASGFQSAQFRQLEASFGRREQRVLSYYASDSDEARRIGAAMNRPSLFDSFLRYLAARGWPVPREVLERDVSAALQPSEVLQEVLVDVYRADGEEAQVCECLLDLDEGLQEWRYRHVKMVERTIGDKHGTGGSSGADYLRRTLFRPMFPDLWAVRSRL
jgi:tryptophan 2,3-dioxygenase